MLSAVLLVLIGLSGPCFAQDPSYGGGSIGYLPKYIPVQYVADPLLDQLFNQIWTLEAREASQLSQLENVMDEADRNVEFQNRFNEVIYPAFTYHQDEQDKRITALEERLDEIRALRQKVQQLQSDANDINDIINNEILPGRKQDMYDIEDLQNADLERISIIKETQQKADDINDRIDVLFEKSWDNTRALQRVSKARLRAAQEVNVQVNAYDQAVYLYPNNDDDIAEVPFNNPSPLGVPQARMDYLTGFHIYKKDSEYPNGYPSIYFGIYPQIDDKLVVASTDMSTGGWLANLLYVKASGIYFSDVKLSLK